MRKGRDWMLVRILLFISAVFSAVSAFVFPETFPWILLILIGLFAFLLFLCVLFLFIFSLFCYTKKPIEKDNAFCRFLGYHTMDSILTLCMCKVKGEGLEKIPEEPIVLISNHLSQLDPMAAFVLLKGRRLAFISKKENMRIPIVGPISQKIGFLPLDRDNPLRAMRTIHFAAKMVKEMDFSVGIYPEGHRSRSGELLAFKTGAFVLAKKADVPLVVARFQGTNLPVKRFPRLSRATFTVLDVLPVETVRSLSAEELADVCRKTIAEAAL